MESGIVFDIQHFSINNGPGIRTTAFLKGCPLRCLWCHNPESFCSTPQPRYMESLCLHCGRCISMCEAEALTINDGMLQRNHDRCVGCGKCAAACSTGAMTMWGVRMTAEELVSILIADKPFFVASEGGATLSGGEPTMQYAFTKAVLSSLKRNGVHTTLDTNGYLPIDEFMQVITLADCVLFDIKQMDDGRHKGYTGVSNTKILQNLDRLIRSGYPMRIRYPLIPKLNDSNENIITLCRFLVKRNIHILDVSVFHDYYTGKYRQMMQPQCAPRIQAYTQQEIEERLEVMRMQGVEPVVV